MSEINNWHKFFEELGTSLNKYNFMISEFVLGAAVDNRIRVVCFNSDGNKVYPVYSIPEDVKAAQPSVQRTWAYGCPNCKELYDSEELFKNHACAEHPNR